MSLFNKFGYYIIKIFSVTGMLILSIPKIPGKLRNINSNDIKSKIDTENLKDNISRIRDDIELDEKISRITSSEKRSELFKKSEKKESDSDTIMIGNVFSSEEKERTILTLQVLSAIFVVMSILSIFNFIGIYIYVPLSVIIIVYILYLLYKRVKLMYRADFNAYRDFF